MVTEADAFCLSCGVARNRGTNCEYCGRLYIEAAKAKNKPAQHRSLPTKYTVKKKNNETIISWRWKSRSTWLLVVIALFWITLSFQLDGGALLTDPLSTFPIPMIPVLVGLFLLSKAVVKLANKTSIHASRQSLSIRHYPIPWRRNIRYRTDEIEQVSVSIVQRSTKERTWKAPVLQLHTTSGVRHAILSGYNEAQFADFETLCHEIQNGLGIKNSAAS